MAVMQGSKRRFAFALHDLPIPEVCLKDKCTIKPAFVALSPAIYPERKATAGLIPEPSA